VHLNKILTSGVAYLSAHKQSWSKILWPRSRYRGVYDDDEKSF